MLFNSHEFILAFLPVTVALFLLFGRVSRTWALGWLIVASVFFYAWWRPFNLVIIGPSILVNYAFACILLGLTRDESRRGLSTFVLALGILFNVCWLGYFKYANFAVSVANDLTGSHFSLYQIILPLGISFITFQKIAFLVDVAGGRIKSFTLREFLLFVVFFPQLIAGPIVHFREMNPQFDKAECRFEAGTFAAALTLFCFGLFKKVVLADGIAEYVSPIYASAASGAPIGLLQGWLAAVGFTLQLYFDFSGYCDMACGAALFFGVRLPMNFNSPLKATSIIDFWLRWHNTLTRFLTAYVYNPIALTVSRWRAAKGWPMLGNRGSKVSAFLQVLVWPTLATMFLSGLWHGAGYRFILFGLLHGVYLVINHTWRQYGPRRADPAGVGSQTMDYAGFALTFFAAVISMVLFRAPDLASAANVLKGMIGAHGLGLPRGIAGAADWHTLAMAAAYCGGLLAIALFLPNTLEVLSKYGPALYGPKRPPQLAGVGPHLYWHPTLPWMIFTAVLAVVAMTRLTGRSEFLYWQF